MTVGYVIQVANTVLEWCSLLDQKILEAHGTGMCERLFDLAMAVVMKVQGPGTSPTTYDDHVLNGYFKLLGKLRGGAHPFLKLWKCQISLCDWSKDRPIKQEQTQILMILRGATSWYQMKRNDSPLDPGLSTCSFCHRLAF